MLAIILAVVFPGTFIAELWLGIVVTGWQGDRMYIERAKNPGPYWLMMALHAIVGFGLPVLAFLADI